MTTEEITTHLLREIRDALQGTNQRIDKLQTELSQTRTDLGRRIDQTNKQLLATEVRLATEISGVRAGLDETNARLDQTNKQLASTEIRLSAEISAVRTSVDDVKISVDELKTSVDHRNDDVVARLERVERDVAELRQRAP